MNLRIDQHAGSVETVADPAGGANGARLLDVRLPWPALREIDERFAALRDRLEPLSVQIRPERGGPAGGASLGTGTAMRDPRPAGEPDSPVLKAISLLRADPVRPAAALPAPIPASAQGETPLAEPDESCEMAPGGPGVETPAARPVVELGLMGEDVRPRSHTRSGWIGSAIRQLATVDSELAGRAILGLLPIQGDVIYDEVSYDLVINGGRCYSVTVTEEETSVHRVAEPRPLPSVDGRIVSTVAALGAAPVAGRLRGRRRQGSLQVEGRRPKRALAALRQVMAAPVSLAQARAAGVDLAGDLLLSLITAAIPAQWTIGHRFTIEFITQGAGQSATRLYLRVNDGRLVSVSRGLPLDVPSATITCRPDELAGVVVGDGSAGDATLAGDRAPLMLLQGWVARLEAGRG